MRTFADILQSVRNYFVSNDTLKTTYNLDSSKNFEDQFSPVALESIQTHITASAIYDHERIVDDRCGEIEARIGAEYFFSIPWWRAKIIAFQLGDELEYNDVTKGFSYPLIDESKQIIRHVALREPQDDGVTKLKIYIAKENKEALSVDEMQAFEGYVRQIGAAGTHYQFVSESPNALKINLRIYYNPQILSNAGALLTGGGFPVNDAVDSYLNGIKYSGAFNRTKLIDEIQKATGVDDAVLDDVLLDDVLNNSRQFESSSGFFYAENIKAEYIASL